MNQQIIHDHAYGMAQAILASVKDDLPVTEHRLAFEDFLTICRRNLIAYELEAERMRKRLGASRN